MVSSEVAEQVLEELRKRLSRPVFQGLEERGKKAAVGVLLRVVNGVFEVLFIKRVEDKRDPWSGQVAFPGGMFEKDDLNVYRTVLREVYEETGIDLAKKGVFLGVLRNFHPRNMPSLTVTPFVFSVKGRCKVRIGREISSFFWVSVPELMQGKREIYYRGTKRKVFLFRGEIIWGMTYRIVDEFLKKIDSI